MIEAYSTLVVLFAFVGEALFGFGGGLVAVPLLSLALDVREAVLITSVFQFLIGFLVFRNLSKIPWKLVLPVMAGMLVGVPIGVASLDVLDPAVLRRILALFILIFLARIRWFPDLSVRSASLSGGLASGLISGFFQGCIGTGGPSLVVYLKQIAGDRQFFRAALIFLLSVANLARIVQVGATGMFSPSVVWLSAIALPFFLIGIILGQRFHRKVPEQIYYRSVYALLFLSALSLMWKDLKV